MQKRIRYQERSAKRINDLTISEDNDVNVQSAGERAKGGEGKKNTPKGHSLQEICSYRGIR